MIKLQLKKPANCCFSAVHSVLTKGRQTRFLCSRILKVAQPRNGTFEQLHHFLLAPEFCNNQRCLASALQVETPRDFLAPLLRLHPYGARPPPAIGNPPSPWPSSVFASTDAPRAINTSTQLAWPSTVALCSPVQPRIRQWRAAAPQRLCPSRGVGADSRPKERLKAGKMPKKLCPQCEVRWTLRVARKLFHVLAKDVQ